MLKLYEELGLDEIISDKPNNWLEAPASEPVVNLTPNLPSKPQVLKQMPNIIPVTSNASRVLADEASTFESLVEKIKTFDGCDLKLTATNTVVYDGTIGAPVLLIGEAPGANEDLQGIPFCGDSGQLLDNYFASIGLKRDKNIIISNSVFWRPPANRKPTPEEVAICRPFVEKLIALLAPKVIILVGSVAASCVLNEARAMSHLRRNWVDYTNQYLKYTIPTTVMFHPAYLLRQPSQKKVCWFDLLHIEKKLLQLKVSL